MAQSEMPCRISRITAHLVRVERWPLAGWTLAARRRERAGAASVVSVDGAGKNRCRIFAVVTAATAPQSVAINVVGMIAVGACAPAAARTPMIVVGMNCTPAVLSTMNVTIGFEAVSLSRIQRLQLFHRLDAERRGGVVESEHVRGDAHHHRPDRRMIGGTSGNRSRLIGRSIG